MTAAAARVVAVVPARGGSVGLPRKNLATFLGRPLVAHAIDTGRRAGVDEVLATTDDDEIAAAAAAAGATIVRRPAELATATSRTVDAVLHALDERAEPDATVVVLLQPTSPLRTAQDVRDCLELHAGRPTGSVVQVAASGEHHPLKACLLVDGELAPVRDWPDLEAPRQLLPPVLRPTGGVYVVPAGELRRLRRFFVPRVLAQQIPAERALDIDTADDLRRAERLAQARSTNGL
ncbi:MAG TPA: acylneuraminate cytidylyltransferase family protein [Pseudonocardiaceae bacterium]|nr:acylneuraminate cytidylyltransferase family protein [Pseudonocardiaceae bacterium]